MKTYKHHVELPTGQKVGYRLALRAFQPYLFVYFRDPEDKLHEKSTGERRRAKAKVRAEEIIAATWWTSATMKAMIRKYVPNDVGPDDMYPGIDVGKLSPLQKAVLAGIKKDESEAEGSYLGTDDPTRRLEQTAGHEETRDYFLQCLCWSAQR